MIADPELHKWTAESGGKEAVICLLFDTRRLHVKEGEKVIEGAEAFLLVWKKIPKYKFLYNFFKLPIVFNIFSFTYEIVAFFLYLKNKKQLKN